jgi:hypothetical protein
MHQRRKADAEVYCLLGVAGEEVAVAPDRRGARFYLLPADRLPLRLPVVVHFQGAEAELADVDRVKGILSAAFSAT